MRHRLTLAIAIIMLGLVFTSQSVFEVDVDGVAVITRGDDVVRVSQPGLRWRNPLVETVHHVAMLRQYQQLFRFDAALKGGAPCRVEGTFVFRASDPIKAYQWRRANGLDMTAGGSRDDGAGYTAAVEALEKVVASKITTMTAEIAAGSAIKDWLAAYRSPVFRDGTIITSIDLKQVSCSRQDLQAAKLKRPIRTNEFGPRRMFATSRVRAQPKADIDVLAFKVPQDDITLSDGTIARFSGLIGRYQVVDPVRFRNAFGERARGKRIAGVRLAHVVGQELRSVVGERNGSELVGFDLYAIALSEDAPLAQMAARLGVAIVDIGGIEARYRLGKAGGIGGP
ncbi:MAG: SPFH domain-containing protein [Pseudomonadota bacterium]